MAEKATSPKRKFYADSDIFCSPHPSKIPLPMYNSDGTFYNGDWTISKRQDPKTLDPKTLDSKSLGLF